MYKVFYNEKALTLTDEPLQNTKSLKYSTNGQFDEAIDMLKNTTLSEVNIFYHNLSKLWKEFKSYFEYLEAAGGIVKNQNDEVLFIHRLGRWDLPKGKVEEGETTEYAAVREVEEECGIHNLILNDLVITTHHLYFQKQMILKATYWYDMDYNGNETLIPQAEEGIKLVEWKTSDDIKKVLPETYENIQIALKHSGYSI